MIIKRSSPKGWRTYCGVKCPVQDVIERRGPGAWVVYRNVCGGLAESVEHYRTRQSAFAAYARAAKSKGART